uniref:RRM domain-containing protein n=1 Tax=Anopheles epiroticus TaxID=199890 RepID=A0A182P853_9DIPT
MPVTWLGHTYVIHHCNGQCLIVLNTKVNERHPLQELYAKNIPRNFGPDELVPIFSNAGLVHTIRLLMDYGQENRGYAYVSYVNPSHNGRALRVLNGMPLNETQRLELYRSRDRRRFQLCNVHHLCTVPMMHRTIAHMTHITDFEYQIIPRELAYDVELNFKSHNDYIHAFNKLNRVKNMFGPSCFVKSC